MTPRANSSTAEVSREEIQDMIAANIAEYDRLTIEPRVNRMHEENKRELKHQAKDLDEVKTELFIVKSDLKDIKKDYADIKKWGKRIFLAILAGILENVPANTDSIIWNIIHHFGGK